MHWRAFGCSTRLNIVQISQYESLYFTHGLGHFFVSVERLMDSRLDNRPIIIGGTGDRGVVAACSYETRKFGVHSAMPVRMARELCPEAIIIRGIQRTTLNILTL